jgi:hypothetical protein
MRQSETRLVLMEPIPHELVADDYQKQTAIPWCTTHDASVYVIDDKCGWGQLATNTSPCVLSTDHRWWCDASE